MCFWSSPCGLPLSAVTMGDMYGERIIIGRVRKGWSQQDLADRVGASLRSVGGWEHDGPISRRYLAQLSEVLGVDLTAETDTVEATKLADFSDTDLMKEMERRLTEARIRVTQMVDVLAQIQSRTSDGTAPQ